MVGIPVLKQPSKALATFDKENRFSGLRPNSALRIKTILPAFKLFRFRARKLLRLVPILEDIPVLGLIVNEESQPVLAIWQLDRVPIR